MKVLQDFRKNIREASSKSKERVAHRRHPSSDEEEDDQLRVSQKASSITKRLYSKPDPLLAERDRFGIRCSMHEKEFGEVCRLPAFMASPKHSQQGSKLYLTTAQRLDLSRPINFNPGPGTYLKETITPYGKYKLSSSSVSVHLEHSVLKKKARDRVILDSIEGNSRSVQ
jgi:hypothetical protein